MNRNEAIELVRESFSKSEVVGSLVVLATVLALVLFAAATMYVAFFRIPIQ